MTIMARHVKTLDYYDGPVLFHARDSKGEDYLCMAVDAAAGDDRYAAFPVSPQSLCQFIYGRMDLRALIGERAASEWYIGACQDGSLTKLRLNKQGMPLSETDYLPESGFFLHPSKLVVALVGRQNSGKSTTWYELFGKKQRGNKYAHLRLSKSECVEVFFVNSSFEEQAKELEDLLDIEDCRVLLCSMQYSESALARLKRLADAGCYLHLQWLNPGYKSKEKASDSLGLEAGTALLPSEFHVRDGKQTPARRAQGVKEAIYDWAADRCLIVKCRAAH